MKISICGCMRLAIDRVRIRVTGFDIDSLVLVRCREIAG